MKRKANALLRIGLAGFLTLLQVPWGHADISNTARISYADTAGTHHALSNTLLITVLQPPVIEGFELLPQPLTLHDTLRVKVQGPFDQVIWNFNAAVGAPLGAPDFGARVGSGYSIATPSPALLLSDAAPLRPGTWHLVVRCSNAAGTSAPLVADIEISTPAGESIRVFPNPWRRARDSSSPVTFQGIPAGGDLKLFTISGRHVRDLEVVNGDAAWNLKNDEGNDVASGLYLYLVTDRSGHKNRGKVLVIR